MWLRISSSAKKHHVLFIFSHQLSNNIRQNRIAEDLLEQGMVTVYFWLFHVCGRGYRGCADAVGNTASRLKHTEQIVGHTKLEYKLVFRVIF